MILGVYLPELDRYRTTSGYPSVFGPLRRSEPSSIPSVIPDSAPLALVRNYLGSTTFVIWSQPLLNSSGMQKLLSDPVDCVDTR